MFLGQDQVDAVRRAVDLSVVAGKYTTLKKAGDHFIGCCPMHAESTGSFHVYEDHVHCFGCGFHADAFGLVQEKESLVFTDAVQVLARQFGVALVDRARTPVDPATVARKDAALAALEWAADRFERALKDSPGANYLEGRGFATSILTRFRVGWAAGDLLLDATAAGITQEALLAADLIAPKDGGGFKERFRRRVVVPIIDAGKVVGFTGRGLPRDIDEAKAKNFTVPKYVNTATNDNFSKSAVLFGLHFAKSAGRRAKRIIVVEGALDVLALAQLGHAESCAPLGTALTGAHALALAALKVPVCLAFDHEPDKRQVVDRTLDGLTSLIRADINARIVTWPGKDPADLMSQGRGEEVTKALTTLADGWQTLVEATAPKPADLSDDTRWTTFDDLSALLNASGDRQLKQTRLDGLARYLGLDKKLIRQRQQDAERDRVAEDAAKPDTPNATTKPKAPHRLFPLTEEGNAQRFRAACAGTCRFVRERGWLIWTGTHWAQDDDAVWRAARAAIDTGIANDKRLALAAKDEHWYDRLDSWAETCQSVRNGDATLVLASRLAEFRDPLSDYDADPYLLPVRNGLVDLRTGDLIPHHPDHKNTRACPVDYQGMQHTDARWTALVSHLTQRPDVEQYLARFIGYSATGHMREKAIVFMQGEFSCGKTLFADAVLSVFGADSEGYGSTLDPNIFLAHQNRPRWEIANADSARYIYIEESNSSGGAGLSIDFVKAATGGGRITFERKGKDPYSRSPVWKLLFLCNQLPPVPGSDRAIWKRFNVVRCGPSVPEAQQDKGLKAHFATDASARSAILAWIIRGAIDYHQRNGLDAPPAVVMATDEHRQDCDHLAAAIDELFFIDSNQEDICLSMQDIVQATNQWLKSLGYGYSVTAKAIGQRLRLADLESMTVHESITVFQGGTDAAPKPMTRRVSRKGFRGIRYRQEHDCDHGKMSAIVTQPPTPTAQLNPSTTPTSGTEALRCHFGATSVPLVTTSATNDLQTSGTVAPKNPMYACAHDTRASSSLSLSSPTQEVGPEMGATVPPPSQPYEPGSDPDEPAPAPIPAAVPVAATAPATRSVALPGPDLTVDPATWPEPQRWKLQRWTRQLLLDWYRIDTAPTGRLTIPPGIDPIEAVAITNDITHQVIAAMRGGPAPFKKLT